MKKNTNDRIKNILVLNHKNYSLTIKGNSMYPTFVNGQVLPVIPISRVSKISEEDIIVYKRKKDGLIIHRVKKAFIILGSKYYITKGDNNKKNDKYFVRKKDIIGIVKHNT